MVIRLLDKGMGSPHTETPLAAISFFHWEEDSSTFWGGYCGTFSREQLVHFLKDGNEAFILDPADKCCRARFYVHPARAKDGTIYVYTKIKGRVTDDLLNLPESLPD